MKLSSIIFFKIFFLLSYFSYSQGIPIGQWRNHLPKNKVIAVAEAENLIYAATPYSIFYFDKTDNSIQQLTKVNGLSDVGISAIHYSKAYKTLVVTYTNANIDLIKTSGIVNLPDIKNKSIPGNKKINNVTSLGKYAYLSCGFGIVVADLVKNEIKDTYIIGDNGSRIDIFDIAINDTIIYTATELGIYKAKTTNTYLSDFHNWIKDSTIRGINSKFTHIAFFKDKIIACKERGTSSCKDTLFAYNGTNWTSFDTTSIRNFSVNGDQLIISHYGFFSIYNELLQLQQANQLFVDANQIILDKNNYYWVADDYSGLLKIENNFSEVAYLIPNGPTTNNVFTLTPTPTGIWLAPGGIDYGSWGNAYFVGTIHQFKDEKWNNYASLDSIGDILDIAVDPTDNSKVYAATWSVGIVEFTNNKVTNVFNEFNSSLNPFYLQGSRYLRIGGAKFDESGNLWATNSGVIKGLSVKYKSGLWESFDVQSIIKNGNYNDVSTLLIDKNNYKWMLARENQLAVFNKTQNIIQKAWININKGNDLASNYIHCFAEDLNGEIWVGTDKGIKVIYSPENVFSTNSNEESSITAQTILVEFEGHVQHLLEFESVTAIAVDGANRKWLGTQKAGVFLLSSDGTQQLAHFTEENSPLFSNSIVTIAINPDNGEVFFGTSMGVISYRGTATSGKDTFQDVYAYPNPVRPEYNGVIAIKGLVRDANVKITDIAGNLIYNTIANGGQAIWNGKNYSGERAHSGVYLVFCTNEDGAETMVTKILFIN
ncbi:MAG: T9SS type A sorting domain-containing protein [Bacteroidetes bacterium]|nr:T9SS type A sorting domain-containing protein [Bacteroidota bacterium]